MKNTNELNKETEMSKKSSAKTIKATGGTKRYEGDDTLSYETILKLTYQSITGRETYKRFGLGFVPKGSSARQVTAGPLVPGPWPFSFGLCTVIDNYGGSGRESSENKAKGIEHDVKDGDIVQFGTEKWSVRVVRREFIEFDRVSK